MTEKNDVQTIGRSSFGIHSKEKSQNNQIDRATANAKKTGHYTQKQTYPCTHQFVGYGLGMNAAFVNGIYQRSKRDHTQGN